MNSLNKIVQSMYGSRRLEETASLADMDTQTYIGIATGDSEEGSVSVWLTDDVTQSDNGIWDGSTWVPADESDTSVVLPTTQSVHKGDRVLVSMFGGNTIATPVVTGVIGGGDSIRQDVDVAQTSATSAEEVANAVNQHFWPDTDGIHVTEVTQEEWQATPSGANVLINSAGQLFRSVLNNLLAILPSGIAIYDGNGNAASNILAQFTANLIRLGGKFAASGRSTAKVQFFEDNSALTDLTAEHYIDTTTDPQVSHSLALSSTTTDDELPDGTSRTVTGNVEVWGQIYHSGSTYSDKVMASLNGMTSNRQNNVSMGVQAIESSGASSQRIAFVTADTVRLTSGTGSQSVTSDTTMPQVRKALNCRSSGVLTMWAGSKVMNVGTSAVSTFILFTKAQLQAIVGTDWTPTVNNCAVFVMNGDYSVTDAMMSASINSSSVVRVHMNKTRTGNLRVTYLIVRIGS